jgi:hypothetical protein
MSSFFSTSKGTSSKFLALKKAIPFSLVVVSSSFKPTLQFSIGEPFDKLEIQT